MIKMSLLTFPNYLFPALHHCPHSPVPKRHKNKLHSPEPNDRKTAHILELFWKLIYYNGSQRCCRLPLLQLLSSIVAANSTVTQNVQRIVRGTQLCATNCCLLFWWANAFSVRLPRTLYAHSVRCISHTHRHEHNHARIFIQHHTLIQTLWRPSPESSHHHMLSGTTHANANWQCVAKAYTQKRSPQPSQSPSWLWIRVIARCIEHPAYSWYSRTETVSLMCVHTH